MFISFRDIASLGTMGLFLTTILMWGEILRSFA